MHIDFKVTTWERAQVPEEVEKQVLRACKEGKITTVNELNDFIVCTLPSAILDDFVEWENLLDCTRYVSLEDNNHDATIEIFSTDGDKAVDDPIWTNTM